jgi:DNA-binding MarR family transcriptional regulator
MRLFEKLRALRAFEKQYLDFFSTVEDHHLVGEIGYYQSKGKPLTLKQLFLLDVGSIATVQRRLRRLKELGLVQQRRSTSDRRTVELSLSPKCIRIFAKYGALMSAKGSAQDAALGNGQPRHVCGLCDSDAGGRGLVTTFLAEGLKRGDKCVLVAPAAAQKEILAALHPRRRAPEQVIVSDGYSSADAQFAFLKRVSQEATQAGQTLCLAANMSWTLAKNIRIDAIVEFERRFDAVTRRLASTCLCVYDARHVSSGDFLRVVKCHRDNQHYPIALA